MLNGRRGPLAARGRCAQAISCAIDRNQVLQTAAYGEGTVTGPITSPAFSYSPTDGLPCTPGDTAKAKSMLAAAGTAAGSRSRRSSRPASTRRRSTRRRTSSRSWPRSASSCKLQQLSTAPYVTAWLAADYDAAVALNGGSHDPYLMYGRYYAPAAPVQARRPRLDRRSPSCSPQGNATSDNATQRQSNLQEPAAQLLERVAVGLDVPSDDNYLVSSERARLHAPTGRLAALARSRVQRDRTRC